MRFPVIFSIAFLGMLLLSCGRGNSGPQVHIGLQVQFAPVIIKLSNDSYDRKLLNAITEAKKGPADGKFVDRFATAYAVSGGKMLSLLFVKPTTTIISLASSDADVIAYLKSETANVAKHTVSIITQRMGIIGERIGYGS